MERLEKCPYCKVPLNETNSVFIKIIRYDDRPDISVKRKLLCTNCWDSSIIKINGRNVL